MFAPCRTGQLADADVETDYVAAKGPRINVERRFPDAASALFSPMTIEEDTTDTEIRLPRKLPKIITRRILARFFDHPFKRPGNHSGLRWCFLEAREGASFTSVVCRPVFAGSEMGFRGCWRCRGGRRQRGSVAGCMNPHRGRSKLARYWTGLWPSTHSRFRRRSFTGVWATANLVGRRLPENEARLFFRLSGSGGFGGWFFC